MIRPLSANFQNAHRSETYTNDGKTYTLAAEVGILSRNIKIVGAPYQAESDIKGQDVDEFGCRVLVGQIPGGESPPGVAQV